ncbi:hypothetical protein TorRG33x02_034050 [Trema orientale]|uniref:Uncharacterized protein n=1 Tax=Trema orientale TaxID=63057 RepID=A0A2P5FSN5_TREOI|nr:hypothetical protein TorRG33x02_034050 [Trema orientale]
MNQRLNCIGARNRSFVVIIDRQIQKRCDRVFLNFQVCRAQQINQQANGTTVCSSNPIVHVISGKSSTSFRTRASVAERSTLVSTKGEETILGDVEVWPSTETVLFCSELVDLSSESFSDILAIYKPCS